LNRNTVIIGLAAAAAIAASIAGYYVAEAQKNYSLTNAELTKALRYERSADEQARKDEDLLIQATIEHIKNETRVSEFLIGQISKVAMSHMLFDRQKNTFSLASGYYDNLYENSTNSEQIAHDYLEHADLSDEYSRGFIVLTSLFTAAVVIFSEVKKKGSQ
jgi:hypothetical protein